MRRVARLVISCFGLSACLAGRAEPAGGTRSAGPLPSGSWTVSAALVDTESTRTAEYGPDDPRLTGRSLVIAPDKLSYDLPPRGECQGPSIQRQSMTTAELVRETMAGREVAPSVPTPGDYHLADDSVEVLWISCRTGSLGPAGPPGPSDRNWIALLPGGRLAIRWFDNTILTLARQDPRARPEPSFDCAKARSPSEKAICGSVELASLDRSVSRSYRMDVKQYGDEGIDPAIVKWVRSSQRQWIKTRDACGGDATCLRKVMNDRLEDLAHAERHGAPTP
jgi:uncharacterized protein YecT (DUF1311 family)